MTINNVIKITDDNVIVEVSSMQHAGLILRIMKINLVVTEQNRRTVSLSPHRLKIEMTKKGEVREQLALYFYEAILNEAVSEFTLEALDNIEANKKAAEEKETDIKKELKADNLKGVNEEDNVMNLKGWKNIENEMKAAEKQEAFKKTTGPVFTKISQLKIAENPYKDAEGYIHKNLVQNSELFGTFGEQTDTDKHMKKGQMKKEQNRLKKRAKEEEKIMKKQLKMIDTMMEHYSKDDKDQWKKELKREQMTNMDRRVKRILEKGVKTKEKEKVKVEMTTNAKNADITKERQSNLKKIKLKKESEKEEEKKTDFFRESKKQQNKEIRKAVNDIEKKEEKTELQTDINDNAEEGRKCVKRESIDSRPRGEGGDEEKVRVHKKDNKCQQCTERLKKNKRREKYRFIKKGGNEGKMVSERNRKTVRLKEKERERAN
ncbi:unnamed protein product [Mytilus coruscus]|uniref:Uncharacterized protein n=1 Tax=Mytilus coruscus TaxID=42192 RepID=A0A6J8E3Y7_MYTCO|nr:unnamed protein product [Mytilus coruscus]